MMLAYGLTLFALLLPAAAQGFRLNEPLARTWQASACPFEITPDGRVVYGLDPSSSPFVHLRSAPLDGSGAPLALVAPATLWGLDGVRLDPSGARAVFLVDDDELALYSVPVNGSQTAVRVSHTHPDGVAILSYLVPDATRVVYSAFAGFSLETRLFSVPLAGGPVLELTAGFAAEEIVGVFAVGGGRVVFTLRRLNDSLELLSVPIGGGSVVRLCPALDPNRTVRANFQISPDGSTVAYVADQELDEVFELYRVPLDGSAPAVKLSGTLVGGGDVAQAGGLAFSPDGSRVVYVADGTLNDKFELYSVPSDASAAPVKLSGALIANGDVSPGFLAGATGARVLYLADAFVDLATELFSVPIDGSAAPTRLNGSLVAGGRVSDLAGALALSPDGTRAVYIADQTSNDVDELFSVPVDGGLTAVRLNAPLVSGGDVRSARISPDSTRVAFLADAQEDEVIRAHVVPLAGGVAPISLEAPCGSDAGEVRFDPSGATVVFTALRAGTSCELLAAPSDASAAPVSIAFEPGVLGVTGDVSEFELGADGHALVYTAEVERLPCGGKRLLATDLAGPFLSRDLLGDETAPIPRLVTPDGRVLYVALPAGLYSAALDGSTPPLQLGALSAPHDLSGLALAGDGSTIVYRGRATAAEPFELFTARTDTAASAERLNAPLTTFGSVTEFQLDPTGRFAVYRADQELFGRFELYLVPLDRSWPARRVSGTLVANGDVLASTSGNPAWRITGDGARVVFLADARTDETFELFSARLRPLKARVRSVEPERVRLARMVLPGADVTDFQLSPDSTTAVYRADQESDERFELYRVRVGGGTMPVRLSGALTAGGDVSGGFAFLADGLRVLYLADQVLDERVELWSVGLAGGSPVPLNGSLFGTNDILSFQSTPDSARVVFLGQQSPTSGTLLVVPADGSAAPLPLVSPFSLGFQSTFALAGNDTLVYQTVNAAFRYELFATPLDGSAGPERLNSALVPGGDVLSFEITPGGKRVLYLADQASDGAVELHVAHLTPPFRRAP